MAGSAHNSTPSSRTHEGLWESDVLSVGAPHRTLTPERRLLWALLEDTKYILYAGCQPRRYVDGGRRVAVQATTWHCQWHEAWAWLHGAPAPYGFADVCAFLDLDPTAARAALLAHAAGDPGLPCTPRPRTRQTTARRRLLMRTGQMRIVA